jgi:hypothetical protein
MEMDLVTLKEVDGVVDSEVTLTRQGTIRCHLSQHSKAQWAHIKEDISITMINDIEGIWKMRMEMMMMMTMMMGMMTMETMGGVEVERELLQKAKAAVRMASQRPN